MSYSIDYLVKLFLAINNIHMDQDNLDELTDDSIVTDETTEEGNEGGETTPNKKNKSNFNSLYKKTKELETALTWKDKELANALAELKEWQDLNPEEDQEIKTNKKSEGLELKVFWLENPDAKPHLEAIKETMQEYGCSEAKAWKLVKVDLPVESKTTTDFNVWKSNVSTKDLSKVSAEDALTLSTEKQREWRKVNLG